MQNIQLNTTQIAELNARTANGTQDFYKGYDYILSLNQSGEITLDSKTQYWFQQARDINANNPDSLANTFIRAHTLEGADHAGKVIDLQAISDKIGQTVLSDLRSGNPISVTEMWRNDISTVTSDYGLSIGGWGGSFYYWNEPSPADPSKTIGQVILGDPIQRATFIDSMSFAAAAATGRLLLGPGSTVVTKENVEGFAKAIGVGSSNLPPGLMADIVGKAIERSYDYWKNSVGQYAGKTWDDIQKSVQGLFGGAFDDFTSLSSLLAGFRESMQIVSPIVLDLDGNGIATTGLIDGAQFDHDGNGYAERTGWVQGQDALLVFDRNGNGRIDNGGELFGSETLLADGRKASNGYEALAQLDDNHDGRIDAQDAAYATLKVWRDVGSDGLAAEGELSTLAAAGVLSIATTFTLSNIVDAQGNTTKQVGSFIRADGSTGQTADIWFAVDAARTRVQEVLPETAAVSALPDLQGFGNVPSLHQAMLREGTGQLQQLVQQFAAATDVPTRSQLLDEILYKWVGVTDVDPASRGGYMPDARQLYVLEAFSGQAYTQGYGYNAGTPNTGWNAAAYLTSVYREFADGINARLMAQTHLAPVFDAIQYEFDTATGTFKPNVTAAIDVLRDMYEQGAGGLSELGDVLHQNGANGDSLLQEVRSQAAIEGGNFGSWLGTVGDGSLVGGDGDDSLVGTSSSEQLIGNGGNDTLDGGAGNDLVIGGVGSDVYVFGRGSGQDSLLDLEGDLDTVRFGAGIATGDLSFERQDYEVVIRVAGSTDTLTLRNWGAGTGYRIERFEFADGTVWGAAQIQARLANVPRIGGDGDDILSAWVGEDTILRGMGGNDNLWGFTGNDSVDGGLGNDFARGYDGNDTLLGGDGNDSLVGDAGSDQLDGGLGDDMLMGDAGDDQLLGGDGNDQLNGGSGANTLIGGLGDDVYVVDSALDVVTEAANGGYDQVFAAVSHTLADQVERLQLQGGDALNGTGNAQSNLVLGNAGTNIVDGLGGDDTLYGNGGSDTVRGGDGNDVLSGDNGVAVVAIGLHGNDAVYGDAGNDVAYGGGGNDQLFGGTGDDTLYGDATDTPAVYQGADTLNGGTGNDLLQGGGGGDTYVFGKGYGNDLISDQDLNAGVIDRIVLEGLTQSDVLLEREAGTYNLVIRVIGASDTLTIANHFYSAGNSPTEYAVESISFADGTSLDLNQIEQISLNVVNGSSANNALSGSTFADYLLGQAGDDTLQGGSGNDVLDGGTGNDVLYGGDGSANGGGNDVFLFGRGSGQDSVIESQTDLDQDRVQLVNLSLQEVTFQAQGNDLIALIEGTTDSLRIVNYFAANARTIETIRFADGSSLDKAAVTQRVVTTFTGTSGTNNIIGSSLNDRIDGLEGNDTLNGLAGNDVLIGGTGNDYLTGGDGEDTYVFRLGDGRDTIVDGTAIGFAGSANDQVIFGAGISPADVQFMARSDLPVGDSDYQAYGTGSEDLVVRIRNTSDQLLITGYISDANRIERFTFENGVVLNTPNILDAIKQTAGSSSADALRGNAGADSIAGLAGDDFIYGFDGDDFIDGGADNDSIQGGQGTDTLIGGLGRDSLLGGAGNDLIEGGDDTDNLSGGDGNDTLISLGDDGYLSGDAGDDILDSGIGGKSTARAYFSGGLGNDRYVLRAGMGQVTIADEELPGSPSIDIIEFVDRNIADFQITQNVANLSVVLRSKANPADVLEIQQLWHSGDTPTGMPDPARVFDFMRFADGSQYTADQIVALSATVATLGEREGSNLSDDVTGGSGGEKIYGYAGDDTLRGGGGDDSLYGMQGSDVLEGGAGSDILDGAGRGITSGDGVNTFIGGPGSDQNIGGLGDDTFIFGRGDGSDTIEGTTGGIDTLRFGAGILPAHVQLFRDGSDLVAVIDGGNTQSRIKSFYGSSNRPVERMVFETGEVWDVAQMEARASTGTVNAMSGTAGNDVFVVDHALDTITGASSGIDEIQSSVTYALPQDVENFTATGVLGLTIRGNSLDNILRGNGGDNEFRISGGNDRFIGGLGDDVYYIERDPNNQLTNITVEESVGEGYDTFRQVAGNWASTSSPSWYMVTLPQNVERLVLGASSSWEVNGLGDINPRFGTGNQLDNEIYGDPTLENRLDGMGGRDLMVGGNKIDVFYVDREDDVAIDYYVNENGRKNSDARTFYTSETLFETGDLVVSTAAKYVLGYNIENLRAAHDGVGNGLDNVLVGSNVYNHLEGGGGNDRLYDDQLQSSWGAPAPVNSYAYVNDWLQGGDGNDQLIALNGDDLLEGGTGNDTLTARGGRSTLIGGLGADNLNGSGLGTIYRYDAGDGDDIIDGGIQFSADGRDRLVFGADIAVQDIVLARTGTGGADLNLAIGIAGSVTIRNFFAYTDTVYRSQALASIEFADGQSWSRSFVDQYFGLPTDPEGTDSDDVLTGNASKNVIYGYAGNDQISGGGGGDELYGGVGNDLLLGEDGDDRLDGGAGDDTLDGGLGVDTLAGGAGNDLYREVDLIIEDAGAGLDTAESSVTATLPENVENLILTGTSAINGTGNTLDNVLTGNSANNTLTGAAGNDTIDGGAGNDTMMGGVGNDTYVVNVSTDVVTELAGEGTDTIQSSVTLTVAANVENLTLTGTTAINGTGNALDNVLIGNTANNSLTGAAGNDTLDGGTGNDTMLGGVGNDTYFVNVTTDVVTENANEGTDTVSAAVTWTLGSNLENLVLTGTSAINGTGNTLNNVLTGNSASNSLSGGTGADTLIGGLGNDTYTVDNTGDVITELAGEGTDTVNSSVTYTLAANVENLTLTGTTAINGTGNTLDNVLTGNSANNTLTGAAGNDTIDGGAGNDTMMGGVGNDTYVVNVSTDVVTELAGEGTDTIQSSVTLTVAANVENLTLTGTTAINGTGNALDNVLIGNTANNSLTGAAGNDTLDGGTGNDTMLGGVGNDTYFVNVTTDVVTENANEGTDTVSAAVTWTLGTNVENLTLTGTTAINGTGNTLDNVLTGNSANNTLTGAAGNDTIDGGTGNDTLLGGAGNDVLLGNGSSYVANPGANSSDTYDGGAGNDTLHDEELSDGDVYRLSLGGGLDLVEDYGGVGDRIEVAAGIAPAQVTVRHQYGDLLVTLADGSAVRVGAMFDDTGASTSRAIEEIRFADGTVWDAAVIRQQASQGSAGADTMFGFNLDDTLTAGDGNDLIYARNGNDLIDAGAGDDQVSGEAGNDTLNGGLGADTLIGGVGDDVYTIDNPGDSVSENVGEGVDTVRSYIEIALVDNVENVELQGTDSFSATGNSLSNLMRGNANANTLWGQAGNDTLQGNAGDDGLAGGFGDDRYVFNLGDGNDLVIDDGGTDTLYFGSGISPNDVYITLSQGGAYVRYSAMDSIWLPDIAIDPDRMIEEIEFADGTVWGAEEMAARIVVATPYDDALMGSEGADVLEGLAGNDTLDGGQGADTLVGGADDDVYIVDDAGDTVVELASEGVDTVQSYVEVALADNVENVQLLGTDSFSAAGNALDNLMQGNANANTLWGLAGNDTLQGNAGDDGLAGGEGDDIYLFNLGDGNDLVIDDGGTDRFVLGAGIAPSDVSIVVAESGTTITYSAFDSIWLPDLATMPARQIESLEFADGTVWTLDATGAQAQAMVSQMAAFGANSATSTSSSPQVTIGTVDLASNAVV